MMKPESKEPKVTSHSSWLLHLHSTRRNSAVILLLLLILLFLTAYLVYRFPRTNSTYYTVVLDCGSTGSRVNLYKWFQNSTHNGNHPILLQSLPHHSNATLHLENSCNYHCLQTEPGLDKFVGNASRVREALLPLLLWAELQIPRERHGDTLIFVLATAGLRKLQIQDADWILDNVEAVVKTRPFMYRKSWIRVLTGQEEAYYGWIALNYNMGRLTNSFNMSTYGVLDMGGSSLQVVMETDELREGHSIVRSKIGSVEHKVLAYSLAAFGLNEAFDRTIKMLFEEQPLIKRDDGRFQLRHPCLGSRVLHNYTCHGCFHPNATTGRNSSTILSNQSSLLNLVGDPDWEHCKELARTAAIRPTSSDLLQLTKEMNCNAQLSPSESTSLQNLTVSLQQVPHFHALSGFFAVYNVLSLNSRANLTTFLNRGQEFCLDLWADLKEFPGNRKYADHFCFNVPYLVSLIKDTLCMGNIELTFGPGDVSWTLGAALVEGRSIWLSNSEAQDGSSTLQSKVISSPVLLIILIVSLFFIVYLAQVMRCARTPTSVQVKKAAAAACITLPSFISPKRQSN